MFSERRMMDINQYSIYTTVSKNENKNQDDMEKASEITAMLHKFDNAENAKEWLKENFQICGDKKFTDSIRRKHYYKVQQNIIKRYCAAKK